MQASTSAGAMPFSSAKRTASNRNGNSSRLTTKPAQSGTSTARLPSMAATACARPRVSGAARAGRAAARLGGGGSRERELDELHPRDGVEDVEADEALGPAAGLGERRDRQR